MSEDFIPDADFKPDSVAPQKPVSAGSDFIPDDQFTPDSEKYGTPLEQLKTGAEGVAQGVLGPLAPALETGLGISTKEAIKARQEANPWTHGISEGVGFLGGALTGTGEAALLEKAGVAGTKALGLGAEGAGVAGRIGSAAVKGAIENSLFSAGDIGSQIVLGRNPQEAVETALPYLGLSAVIGGVAGGALGSVSELWRSRYGEEAGGVLRGIHNKLGGSVVPAADPIKQALETVGIKPNPEIMAAMSNDPAIQGMAKALEQSDVTSSGQAYQKALKEFHLAAQDAIGGALGKTPEELEALQPLSKYEAGKDIGKTLADEYQTKLDPISKEFEELKGKYKEAPLTPDVSIPGQYTSEQIPGTASKITDELHQLSEKEGWVGGDKDIQNELKRVIKALPKTENLGDLTKLITQIGNNTKSTLPFGQQTPLSRAGQLIKNVLREHEDQIAIKHLGNEAPELVQRFDQARQGYKGQAALRDALNDRLKVNGSVSGFAKGIREMANTDGESVLNRLSGKGDAHLLSFLEQNFPKTAQAIKDYHLANIVENAVNKAKPEEKLNIAAIQKSVKAMSPELRDFVLSKDQQLKLEGMQILQDRLNRVPHNFSNTSRAGAVMNKYGLSSAIGLASVLTGHGPVTGLVAAGLGHFLSKTAPDATRLGLLKFIGSEAPINSAALKATVDFIHSAQKGESLLINGSKAIFDAGSKVIPDSLIPDEKSRQKLQEAINGMNQNQNSELNHYLPDHHASVQNLSNSAVQYLSAIAPKQTEGLPFDQPAPMSKTQEYSYNRQLDIAEQPLMALKYLKDGVLMPQDIQTVKTIYPALYQKMAKNVHDELLQSVNDGKKISYSQKMNIASFIGQPLDSTMTPQAAQSVMASAKMAPQPQMQGGKKQGKVSGTALTQISKMNKLYQTNSQAREASQRS